ncbi:MAG: hypothetical protein ACTTKN_09690 [Phocaeicola sp.]|uniref:hypothetical protein n=1 Tax=Phocaeicola TaxID=909656 RepID=UPI00234EF59A|nr:hypothetical protein [Phocaeicola oris]MCE2617687.1 hypothetical protein [Phocaeicola oris]
MIAKINLDGKEHIAIVLDEVWGYEAIWELKHAINSFMQSANASDDTDFLKEDVCNLHRLMGEIEISEDQAFEMFRAYFGSPHPHKKAEKKLCEIYI